MGRKWVVCFCFWCIAEHCHWSVCCFFPFSVTIRCVLSVCVHLYYVFVVIALFCCVHLKAAHNRHNHHVARNLSVSHQQLRVAIACRLSSLPALMHALIYSPATLVRSLAAISHSQSFASNFGSFSCFCLICVHFFRLVVRWCDATLFAVVPIYYGAFMWVLLLWPSCRIYLPQHKCFHFVSNSSTICVEPMKGAF